MVNNTLDATKWEDTTKELDIKHEKLVSWVIGTESTLQHLQTTLVEIWDNQEKKNKSEMPYEKTSL